MGKSKLKKCKAIGCNNEFAPYYSTLQPYCSAQCAYNEKKRKDSLKPKKEIKRIPQVSKKRKVLNAQYSVDRIEFLGKPENKYCKINGSQCTKLADTIEHSKGRIGFADDEKRNKNIPLLLDKDYWVAACCSCNLELENNLELSKKHQLSKIHNGPKI